MTMLAPFQSRTGSPGHLAHEVFLLSFEISRFQSRTGSPGHLAVEELDRWAKQWAVSIPNGLPRPFSRTVPIVGEGTLGEFQSRTGSPGHLALVQFERVGLTTRFQSRTGSPGHLAYRVHSWVRSGG